MDCSEPGRPASFIVSVARLVHMVEPDRMMSIDVGENVEIRRGTIKDAVYSARISLPTPRCLGSAVVRRAAGPSAHPRPRVERGPAGSDQTPLTRSHSHPG